MRSRSPARGRLRLLAALAALAAPPVAMAAPILVIDDFEQGSTYLEAYPGAPVQSALDAGLAGVLGGERFVKLLFTEGAEVTAKINYRRYSGYLSLNQDFDTRGSVVLTYGHSADLNANLSAGGGDRFRLALGPVVVTGDVEITISTTGLGSSTATVSTGVFTGDADLDVFFSAFSPVGATGASFSNVDRIQVRIDGGLGGTYGVKSIVIAVPEPSALGMILLGAMFLAMRLRKPRVAPPEMG